MKHTRLKLMKLFTICMAAFMLLAAVPAPPASAAQSSYEEQVRKYEERKKTLISVDIQCVGGYALKSSKLYGREIVGVSSDGEMLLGSWQCLDNASNVTMGIRTVTTRGTYAQFAYSCDILWGTDFPYSGIFWTNIDMPIDTITIHLGGLVRMVDVDIYVNSRLVVHEYNCDSHSEWRP